MKYQSGPDGKSTFWKAFCLTAVLACGIIALFHFPLSQRLWTWALHSDKYYARSFWADTSVHEHTRCPETATVILTGGQSNAANSVSVPIASTSEIAAFQWYQGECYLLSDPLLWVTGSQDSIWSGLGQELARDQSVISINTAVGATSYRAWLDRRSGYFQRVSDAVNEASWQGLVPDLVFWHQGESDAGRGARSWVYRRDLTRLMTRLQNVVPEAQIVLFHTPPSGII